ncbi:MAG: DUF4342 domain-containing protein [Gemmatimonadota bacterium]
MDYDEYKSGGRRERDDGGSAGGERDARTEEHRVPGDQVLRKVKELIREGNIRRISIRNEEGRTLLEIPMSLGVVGAVLAPTFAAVGAVAALVTNCSIVVERADE